MLSIIFSIKAVLKKSHKKFNRKYNLLTKIPLLNKIVKTVPISTSENYNEMVAGFHSKIKRN